MTDAHQPRAEMLFEVSWEVCNKVGGIYTVIKSKLPCIQRRYPGYALLGPMMDSQEFSPRETPKEWQEIFKALKARGVSCRYGAWRTPGEPTVIQVDGKDLDAGAVKHTLWERYDVDSLKSSFEFDEPMLFSTACGMLVEEYAKRHNQRIVLHAHEWMTGFSLLHCKTVKADVATVFTTHATILGRTIMGNGFLLYDILDEIDPREWAYKLNVQDKHLAETACANHSDVFTTVSEITGMEAETILGRKPDVLVFNGFTTAKFATFEETSIRHAHSRDVLRELSAYAFFPHYVFDLEKTLFFFTSGRYEFHNKGMDILIEALGKVNERLQGTDTTIVMLFWVIMGRLSVRQELIENKNYYYHIKSYVDWQSRPLLQKVILDFLSGHRPGDDDHFTSDFIRELHQEIAPLKREGTPPLTTHAIENEDRDPVVTGCRANNLMNREEDRVKVLLYPGYLDGSDGLLNLEYYDATVGCHLGIFPSHYEPWGYTPLESAVLGVPAITTDLAGFGRHISHDTTYKGNGVFVMKRQGKEREEIVAELADQLHSFAVLSHEERVRQGFAAKMIADTCDWETFIDHYIEAHNLALHKKGV